jgi:hypothetical protein
MPLLLPLMPLPLWARPPLTPPPLWALLRVTLLLRFKALPATLNNA